MTLPDIVIEQADTACPAFLALPYDLYRSQPTWRAPLRMERSHQIGAKNPAYKAIEACFILARQSGRFVGRIAVFINADHDAAHDEGTAFFGYFDCIDDPDVADRLLQSAKDWAKSQGRARLRGPAMWSVNEEVGLLIEGFDHPPAVMMPYGHPYLVAAIERNGFQKAVDLYAFRADLREGAPTVTLVKKLRASADADAGLRWRSLDKKDFMGDVHRAREIFNDAWSDNFGFIPFSETQFTHMAKEMKPIMFGDGFQIGFIDDEPAAFIWMIPDVNELVCGFDGKLLPFNWAKLLLRLKRKQVGKGRVPLMGLKRKFQKGRRGVALTTEICSRAFDAGKAQGFSQCELSWVLADNRSMTGICELVGADRYKTYRIVETTL